MKYAKKELVCETLPTKVCHASTVLKLENGNFLCSWFGGSKEGEPDVDIWIARRNDGKWQKPERISIDEAAPHWNPVLFQLEDKIALYFKVGKPITAWKTYVAYSYDNGESWSEPEELVKGDESGGRGPVKNKPLRLMGGTLLAPASVEDGPWRAFVDISEDNGATWKKTSLIAPTEDSAGIIQPTLWEEEGGRVHMLLRSNQGYIKAIHPITEEPGATRIGSIYPTITAASTLPGSPTEGSCWYVTPWGRTSVQEHR